MTLHGQPLHFRTRGTPRRTAPRIPTAGIGLIFPAQRQTAPAESRFYLYFEGANDNAYVYLNSTLLGQHNGGYTAFIFDATSARRDGDNVLAVRVDNANHPGLRANGGGWVHYGGLHRKSGS